MPVRILDERYEHIPASTNMKKSTVKALDGTIREIYHVPAKHRNIYVDLHARAGFPLLLRFDKDGWSYVEIPRPSVRAKGDNKILPRPSVKLKVYFKDDYDSIIDHIMKAKDWCDACGMPLNEHEDDMLVWASSGDTVAELYTCPYCEHPNKRDV